VRGVLDGLYRTCGALAAFCIVLIAALVVAQVAGRLVGVFVPGADDLAGYALTASSFLALAHTLRANGHIRLTLLIRGAGPVRRFLIESSCLAAGALITGYFAYHAAEMVRDAYRFGDRAQGVLPVPLWMPQAVMTLGAAVLCIAFVDDLFVVLRGGLPSYGAHRDDASTPITREG
jgi:TRAP-type C4-dicarboxylate transport system permease small subunit